MTQIITIGIAAGGAIELNDRPARNVLVIAGVRDGILIEIFLYFLGVVLEVSVFLLIQILLEFIFLLQNGIDLFDLFSVNQIVVKRAATRQRHTTQKQHTHHSAYAGQTRNPFQQCLIHFRSPRAKPP